METMNGQQLLTSLTQHIATLESENNSLRTELASFRANNEPISRGRRGDSGGRRIKRGGVCKHSCAHHKELMDPAIWSTLPIDILQMIFARLPLTNIIRLQCLSREWRRIAKQPGFRHLCANANPNPQFLAWVSEDDRRDLGVFAIRLWDITSGKWHAFEVATPYHHYFHTMRACDGGLVCFISRMKDKVADPLMIVVVNPLTREWRLLPSCPPLKKLQPIMVQIVVNRNTMSYRVVVVVENRRGGISGWVYSSASGMWESAKSTHDLIFGNEFRWRQYIPVDNTMDRDIWEGNCLGPSVFDGSKAQLLDIGEEALEGSIDYALVGDRLYVLDEDETDPERPYSRFAISEYQWPEVSKEMVVVLSGGYDEENEFEYVNVQGCRGFLFVTAEAMELECTDYFTWLYDLSTQKWHTVPILPDDLDNFETNVMCELRWDAVP